MASKSVDELAAAMTATEPDSDELVESVMMETMVERDLSQRERQVDR